MAELEEEKAGLEAALSGGTLTDKELREASERYGKLNSEIEESTIEWMALAERAEGA
ncbi:MAG: hypothetical protein ACNA78_10265 [Balneolaceae bacterium]